MTQDARKLVETLDFRRRPLSLEFVFERAGNELGIETLIVGKRLVARILGDKTDRLVHLAIEKNGGSVIAVDSVTLKGNVIFPSLVGHVVERDRFLL
jgi:hypothetical protein